MVLLKNIYYYSCVNTMSLTNGARRCKRKSFFLLEYTIPTFIFTTCYFLISIPKWRFQSICLLLLTIFPVFNFPTFHNLMALSFFLSSFYPLSTDNRFSFYSIPYLFAIPLALHSLLYGEILAITILCCYHANILCYKQYLLNKHDILN